VGRPRLGWRDQLGDPQIRPHDPGEPTCEKSGFSTHLQRDFPAPACRGVHRPLFIRPSPADDEKKTNPNPPADPKRTNRPGGGNPGKKKKIRPPHRSRLVDWTERNDPLKTFSGIASANNRDGPRRGREPGSFGTSRPAGRWPVRPLPESLKPTYPRRGDAIRFPTIATIGLVPPAGKNRGHGRGGGGVNEQIGFSRVG